MGIETALMAVSIGTTALGTFQEMSAQTAAAQASAEAARFRAQVAENNRQIALLNAEQEARNEANARRDAERAREAARDARDRGITDASQQRIQTRLLRERQRAAMAGANITIDQDSALDLMRETAGIGERDALTIRDNAEREALGFEQQATGFGVQAENFAVSGQNARLQASNFETERELFQASARNSIREGRARSQSTLFGGLGSVADKWYTFRQA